MNTAVQNNKALVSIIMPTYNHGKYIGRALKSLINQTYTNWEVIVVDNHSTDDTDKIVSSFSDPRIIKIKIYNDGIIAKSRNAGIREARGEWIAFLDSDDSWTDDKLKICVDLLDERIDFLYHDLEIISEKRNLIGFRKTKSRQLKGDVFIDLLIGGNPIPNSSVMVRASLINKINGMCESPRMIGAEDYNAWLKLSKLTNRYLYLPKKMGFYLVHAEGVSRRNNLLPTRYAIKEFIENLSESQKNELRLNLIYSIGRSCYLRGEYAKSKKYLKYSFCSIDLLRNIKIIYMMAKMIWV